MDQELTEDFIDAAVHDQPKAKRLLEAHPELRDARWIHHETVLHFLAVEGYADAVRFLGSLGFDPNAANEFGDPPLIDVATIGNGQVAEVLLAVGADPNATSLTQDNVLHSAVRSGNARLVELLLSAGARADYVTEREETVFDALPQEPRGRAAVEEVLVKHGVRQGAA
ncbi:MAG TPA: ankyrin repeat domain-containing protein [Pyrinomonadaceae bacterium]|nr:ankyrin repeat domain-containing protein [Pyrinomonadaceae bacterium]